MRPDFIETFTGRRFRPLSPDPEEIDIRDIAHALSQQCRFSGHTRVPYSVAQHSVLVAHEVERCGGTREEQLWGLLHDASEAYLVDIPSPLKHAPEFAAYRVAEERMMQAVCKRFDLPLAEPRIVRAADETLLGSEARDLMPFLTEHWGGWAPSGKRIIPWGPFSAKDQFLFAYEELSQ